MARQAGMTLIELTVVLLVLIGLAGLMIPYVSGFVSKTHDSTGSDSLASLNSAIQRYDVQYLGQPNNYDSLLTDIAAGGDNTDIYDYMMGGTATNNNNYLKTVQVPGSALAGVGIDSLMTMNATTTDATFQATNTTATINDMSTAFYTVAAINVKGATCVMADGMGCLESDDDLAKILGRRVGSINTSANDYVLFGVGSDSAMVGKTVSEAPVHFAKTGAMSAANKYNRILAVYEIALAGTCAGADADATAGVDPVQPTTEVACIDSTNTIVGTWTADNMSRKAKFLTTIMPMMKLEGLGGALASHYSSVDN